MSKIALIDGDIVAYRCAASCEPTRIKEEREPLEFAIGRADELVYRILSTVEAEKYRIFLGSSDNFRLLVHSEYKANRTRPRPEYLEPVREFLVDQWHAEICAGYEADDGIGIAANEDSIICSIDKDVTQIPGEHYNFVRNEFFVVDEDTAALTFWTSMLVGDPTDNVRGVRGIGRIKAKSYLEGLPTPEMYYRVLERYPSREEFVRNYRLLRVLRSEEEYVDLLGQIQGTYPPKDNEGQDLIHVSFIDE